MHHFQLLKDNHRRLSKCSLDFLQYMEQNPELLERSNYNQIHLHSDLVTLQPWPTYINEEFTALLQEAGIRIFKLIKSIPQRLFKNDQHRMQEYYGLPLDVIKFQLEGVDEVHLDRLLSRGDFIFSPEGLKCLEYNVSATLGGLEIPFWKSLYLRTPLISQFLANNKISLINRNLIASLLNHLVISSWQSVSPRSEPLNLVMIIKGYQNTSQSIQEKIYVNRIYKKILRSIDERLTGKVILCDYNQLKIINNYLYYHDTRVELMMDGYHGLIPLDILEVSGSGNLIIFNGPITGLLSNKLNLAILSENEDCSLFSSEEQDTIKRYIPWSRKVSPGMTRFKGEKVDLIDTIMSHKDYLVLKPSVGYGGEGVFIGRKYSESEWEEVVGQALLQKNWLAQEYCNSLRFFYHNGLDHYEEHIAVWGIFVFGGNYGGVDVRILPSNNKTGVINAHQGASTSVVLEVNEEN